MIVVDVAEQGPPILDPRAPLVRNALAALARHYEHPTPGSAQRHPPVQPTIYGHATVKDALREAFSDKCAYCESLESPLAPFDVDHFRPIAGAMDADGTISPEHYWWLTYAWDNLLLACSDCVRAKGTRFPVLGPRSPRDQPVADERAVLLDPRRHTETKESPSVHLVFLTDGEVASSTDRGRATIDAFALNRANLVAARRDLAADVTRRMDAESRRGGNLDELRMILLDPSGPYLALRRQLIGTSPGDETLAEAPVSEDVRRRTKAEYDVAQTAKQSHALAEDDARLGDDAARSSFYAAARRIDRVVIRNYRPIDDLELDLARSSSSSAPWLVLLGDNGSGKSSILQAIALTLAGPSARDALGVTAKQILRHRARRGRVEVYLSGLPQPLTLDFDRTSDALRGTDAPRVLVLGYGSTRLLRKRGDTDGDAPPAPVRVDNLFDPLAPITDPTTWLLGLDDAAFDAVSLSLKSLLTLHESARIERRRDSRTVFIRHGRRREPLDELSEGYQSMLVLACDVMRTVMSLWPNPQHAEGVVLIDELGAHLHPRWRMRIVGALRSVLPRVQVVMTTHDPLCLRGLEDGEVVVVRRNDDGAVVTISDLPPVKGLRVEQLLTSEHFGLGSTEDPEVDELFREYYTLRGKARPTAQDQTRVRELEARLGELRQLGTTERERLLLRSADEFIARRRAQGDSTPPPAAADNDAAASVVEEMVAIWNDALAQ